MHGTDLPASSDRHAPFPLRDVQEAYWLGRSSGFVLGNVAAYGYYEYAAPGLDMARFDTAWQVLIRRHDMLRMIVEPDGRQRILEDVPPFHCVIHDLRALPTAVAEAELGSTRQRLSHQRLAYDRWPIFSVEVSLLADGSSRLHVGIDFIWCDAWSFRVLLRELVVLYADRRTELPPLTYTFRDYVHAERRRRESAAHDEAWRYWMARLDDMPGGPGLPLAAEPETLTEPRFGRASWELDSARWRAIKARAARAGVTTTTALLELYAELLALYSGDRRFTINVTLFSRLPVHPDVDRLVGDFTSLLPLVVEHDGSQSFVECATALQGRLWSDIDHRLVGSTRVMRERARRTGSHRAGLLPIVFTSLIGMQELPANVAGAPYFVPDRRVSISQTPQVWLDFIVMEVDGGLWCALQYVEGLLPGEVLEGLVESFGTRLAQLAADDCDWHTLGAPEVPSSVRARWERHRTVEPPANVRLEELFLRQVPRRGNAPAVLSPRRELSYEELDRLSAAVALEVQRHGAPGCLAAVVMEKGWEQVVAALGVLRAGAAYVPLDPALPAARLHQLLAETDAVAVLTQSWVAERLTWPTQPARIVVDRLAPAAGSAPVPHARASSDLAYVIFTSGSTGKPKGVEISHAAAANTVIAVNRLIGAGPEDRILSVSSLSFDLSVYDIFGMLAAGGAIVLPEATSHPDPVPWLALMGQQRVTLWNSVPALLQLLLERAGVRDSRLETLRVAMASGDWVPIPLREHLRTCCPGGTLLAMGGATEASIWSNYKWVHSIDPAWRSIPYGRPLPNQALYVFGPERQECPVWTVGEIYIGGAGVARGYWRDAERTCESFIPHPRTGERLYRTGDFGRYLPDGEIEFLGRRDTQVKLSGHRIELGEIEFALTQHADVRSGAVGVCGDADRRSLVAYVVPTAEARLDADEIRAHLQRRVPAYMVPRHVVFLDALPLSANGKVDRGALPAPASPPRSQADAAPVSAVERIIAGLWGEVLERDDVDVQDDFFALGGDSLSATRVVTRVNAAFGCELPVAMLFDHPTLAQFCQVSRLQPMPASDRAGGP